MEESAHLLLAVGSVFLVTWYGVRRMQQDRAADSPAQPREDSFYRQVARLAVAGEFHRSAEPRTEYAGGHVVCAHCGIEYPAGVCFCDCGRETIDGDEYEDAASPVATDDERLQQGTELVCVHVAENCWQASLLKGYLENQNIPCATGGNVPSTVYPFSATPLAEVRLYVHARMASRARRLLRECISD